MNKIIKYLIICACFIVCGVNAQVTSQTLCFKGQKNNRLELILQKYLDNSLQLELGGFVKYSSSKTLIPIVFLDDSTTGNSTDFELHWLEIFNKKVTGEYTLVKPANATIAGAYLRYKNYKSGNESTFGPSGKSSDQCLSSLK